MASSSRSSGRTTRTNDTSLYVIALAPLYVAWRAWMANQMPIMDCDEVYNYWDPLYFVLNTSSNKGGQQTWEYAHEYGLRTYAYLIVPWVALRPLLERIITAFGGQQQLQYLSLFRVMRAVLGGAMAFAELIWLTAIHRRLNDDKNNNSKHPCEQQEGSDIVMWTAVVLLTSAGMNHAAAAYLPSTTFALAWLLAAAAFLSRKYKTLIAISIVATLATGWPFGVVVLVPTGLGVLVRTAQASKSPVNALVQLLFFVVLVTAVVQGLVVAVDRHYYGVWISPTWNIFQYNAAGGGDELYGVEPTSYYVKNLILNFNFVAPLALGVGPVLLGSRNQPAKTDLLVLVSALYLWMAITVPRPHKEERFLFPIYPLLVFSAVLTWDHVLNFVGRLVATLSRHKCLSARQRRIGHALLWIPVMSISIARGAALRKYYTAPLDVYAALAEKVAPTEAGLVCTCGEWYRFPSSFFLPNANMQLGFLPSPSFDGQLPQPFSVHGSRPESQAVQQPFNDQNRREDQRFTTLDKCSYLVEIVGGGGCSGLRLDDTEQLELLVSFPFLDSEATSALHRILYLPKLHEKAMAEGKVKYLQYGLYKVLPS